MDRRRDEETQIKEKLHGDTGAQKRVGKRLGSYVRFWIMQSKTVGVVYIQTQPFL